MIQISYLYKVIDFIGLRTSKSGLTLFKIYTIPLKHYISIEYRFRQALRLYDLKSYTVNILDIII